MCQRRPQRQRPCVTRGNACGSRVTRVRAAILRLGADLGFVRPRVARIGPTGRDAFYQDADDWKAMLHAQSLARANEALAGLVASRG